MNLFNILYQESNISRKKYVRACLNRAMRGTWRAARGAVQGWASLNTACIKKKTMARRV